MPYPLGSDAHLILIFTLLGSATSAFAVAIAPYLNRQLDRFRPTAQRGMRVIAALDNAVLDGDARLKFSWYDMAVDITRALFKDALTPAEIKEAADWAITHYSVKAHEAKALSRRKAVSRMASLKPSNS